MAMSARNAPGTPGQRPDLPRIAFDWSIRVLAPSERSGAVGRHDDLSRAEREAGDALRDLPSGVMATAEIRKVRLSDYLLGPVIEVATLDVGGRITWDPRGSL